MKKLIVIASLTFILQNIFAQEYIVKIIEENHIVYGNNLYINNNKVSFDDTKLGIYNMTVPLEDVVRIDLKKNSPSVIEYQTISFDTIQCSIDSIVNFNTYYTTANSSNSIDNGDVFGIFFNSNLDRTLDSDYRELFLKFRQKRTNVSMQILNKENKTTSIENIKKLNKTNM